MLGYPTTGGTIESQQFGPANPGAAGYYSQPAMYGYGSTVANWTPYKDFSFYEHYHNGLDIAGQLGTPLVAMEAGKVIFAGWRNNGGGLVVEIEIRPGTRYSYNHCSAVLVKYGQIVAKGKPVARIGATGVATGNHCHVSLEINERGPDGYYRWLAWNPKLWMSGGTYANDGRIAPAYALVPRLSAGITADGVNIRTAPTLTASTLFAVTNAGRVRRYKDWADLGLRTARFRYYQTVQGDAYVINGKWGNAYVQFYLGGGRRFVAKPFASAVGWYPS